MTKNGWKMIGSQCCGPAGSVVIYDETSAGNDHAAFSVGGGLICQHNPGRCRFLFLFVVFSLYFLFVVCLYRNSQIQRLTRPQPAAPQATGASTVCIAMAAEVDAL
jgi:hypothetical protein